MKMKAQYVKFCETQLMRFFFIFLSILILSITFLITEYRYNIWKVQKVRMKTSCF